MARPTDGQGWPRTPIVEAASAPTYPTALDRSGWSALSGMTNSGAFGNAVDGSVSTRWDSGGFQSAGMIFGIDLGASATIQGVSVDYTHDSGDYPNTVKVETSPDGSSWTEQVAAQAFGSGSTIFSFDDPVTARYLRLTIVSENGSAYWSIDEINLYPGLAPVALPSSATGWLIVVGDDGAPRLVPYYG